MLCVMGVLKTKKGLLIKNKISEYLKPYFDVLYIEQEPPGTLFEYPAILYTLKTAIEMKEPVLYIHTKGASDPCHSWYQKPVKQLWEQEFGTKKVIETYKKASIEEPTVICPIAGDRKQTWFNGMIINSAAAEIILPTLKEPYTLKTKYNKIDENTRFYYEYYMCNIKEINVISSAINGICSLDKLDNTLKSLTKNLPDIDY